MSPLSTRERWFCAYCGQMTTHAADRDGRARCAQHRGLELDLLPPDEVESLPVMAVEAAHASREDSQAARERERR